MKILMNIEPELNKWIKTEKEWLELFKSTLINEFGKGDLDGELINMQKLPNIKQLNK